MNYAAPVHFRGSLRLCRRRPLKPSKPPPQPLPCPINGRLKVSELFYPLPPSPNPHQPPHPCPLTLPCIAGTPSSLPHPPIPVGRCPICLIPLLCQPKADGTHQGPQPHATPRTQGEAPANTLQSSRAVLGIAHLSGTPGFMPTRSVFRGQCHCCLICAR